MIINSEDTLFYNSLVQTIMKSDIPFILTGSVYGMSIKPSSDIDFVGEKSPKLTEFLLFNGFKQVAHTASSEELVTTIYRHPTESIEIHLVENLNLYYDILKVMDEFSFFQINESISKQLEGEIWKAAKTIAMLRQKLGSNNL